MPIPPSSRNSRTMSPASPAVYTTPISARVSSRTTSSYSTYTPTVTPGGTSTRLNIVTKVSIEGKAKQGEDGAAIRMYLRMAVPVDSVVPGTTIPLFPEENIKILSSQVHPLDNNSVPYNFSSTVSPLLHRAACALNLPARSQESFNSVFDLPPTTSNASATPTRSSKQDNSEKVPPVDPQYTGHILVSGYNISYVLPRVFPNHTQDTEEPFPRPSSRSRNRRASISERNTAQFMAAIDMWVPYVSRPPRFPYLLSIPTPRCLHNQIKLRIFPPNTNTSNSYASLSSIEDEGTSWDLTSDPHVTRTASTRLRRTGSHNNFADDESSDSSVAGFSEGCGIQGTFPSSERIRIRWARPSKALNLNMAEGDGRRRAGVKSVKGEMTCVVRGKEMVSDPTGVEGILMDVTYSGSCSGVWFPGVATLLGMDVGLEAKGCDVVWPEGYTGGWEVSGGNGYMGVATSSSVPTQPSSRGSSFNSNPADADLDMSGLQQPPSFLGAGGPGSRTSSTSSSSSLLRAPLPAAGVGEYSLDVSTSSEPPSGLGPPISAQATMSSITGSISTPALSQVLAPPPPGQPITLNLNINELLPPAKNLFTFTISGTILLIPRNTLSRMSANQPRSSSPLEGSNADLGLVMLPRFTVLAADSETTSTILRNELDTPHGAIEVYNPSGDIHRDAQAKKTVLQKGGYTKCGNDGGRILVKDNDPFKKNEAAVPASLRSPTPALPGRRNRSPPTSDTSLTIAPIISVASATVVPFVEGGRLVAYNVTLHLRVPVIRDSDWLEFGFVDRAGTASSTQHKPLPPKLQLVSATVDGLPVEIETSESSDLEASAYGLGFDKLGGKEWASWVKLKVASLYGSAVVVEYLVKEDIHISGKREAKPQAVQTHILLPTFALPVSKFDVTVSTGKGLDVARIFSNLAHQHQTVDGYRFMHFSVDEFFYPQLSLSVAEQKGPSTKLKPYFIITWMLLALAILMTTSRRPPYPDLRDGVTQRPPSLSQEPLEHPVLPTVTVVTTVYETITVQHSAPSASPVDSEAIVGIEDLPSTSLQTVTMSSPTSTPTMSPTSRSQVRQPQSTIPPLQLQPLHETFHIPWPEDFSRAQEVYEKMREVAAVVWKYLRKAYHYPLEAP